MRRRWIVSSLIALTALFAPATGSAHLSNLVWTLYANLPGILYHPIIIPSHFSTTINNPYLPLKPGTRFIYQATTVDGIEETVVEVTRRTRTVMGVKVVVVHDVVRLNGELVEDTFDWYAQHRGGTVWYFGEATKAYEDGKVSTEGSWEAGKDGAYPGIVMLAHAHVGNAYRQEWQAGVAEDEAEVLSRTASATVAYGSFSGMIKTKDFTDLEPEVVEHKYYARGIGNVLTLHVKGPPERVELVDIQTF